MKIEIKTNKPGEILKYGGDKRTNFISPWAETAPIGFECKSITIEGELNSKKEISKLIHLLENVKAGMKE